MQLDREDKIFLFFFFLICSKSWFLAEIKLECFRLKIFSLWKSSRGLWGIQDWVLRSVLRQARGWIPVFPKTLWPLPQGGRVLQRNPGLTALYGGKHSPAGDWGRKTPILQCPCKPNFFAGMEEEWLAWGGRDAWAVACRLQDFSFFFLWVQLVWPAPSCLSQR